MKRNRFIIVGLGNIGQALLRLLPKDYELICIDKNPASEELAKAIRDDVKVIIGDATSRLVLEEAEVENVDGIIISTTTEKVNIEVARLLHENFDTKRVIGVGITPEGIEAFEALGVEVENIFSASAIGIRNRLEQKTRTTHSIGIGKNEILEVEVHPSSRLANKPIGFLAPIRWRIGLIYRDDNIIIPRKDTVLKPKDRVIILGDPNVLKTVSEILTFSFERFPLEYGSVALAYLTGYEEEEFFGEIEYVLSVFPLQKIVFIFSQKAAEKEEEILAYCSRYNLSNREIKRSSLPLLSAIEDTINYVKGDQGLIFLSKKHTIALPGLSLFDYKRRDFLQNIVSMVSCPVLLCDGSFPYERMVIPSVEGVNTEHVLGSGFEIASSLSSEITALIVEPSKYIASDEDFRRFQERKKTLSAVSLMYKTPLKTVTVKGNPVKAVTTSLKEFQLLVIDTGEGKLRRFPVSLFSPDIVWNIIKRSSISTMIIPPMEEAL